MAKFELCFKQICTYYDHEVVEADSLEEAEAIAASLVENEDFQRRIDDEALYEYADYYVNEGCCAWETTSAVTLSKMDINEYLNGEE